jgi:carbon-monoxide dehydrogenase small subunit
MLQRPNAASVSMTVNGTRRELNVEPHETLADVLRERLDLTGTKIGCNRGDCGACTVLVDGQAILSCLTLAIQCHGKSVTAIEGLENAATGELDPIQKAFIENFGIQCGYCIPGIVMSARALLNENDHPTENEIREGIQGNLCRCTGYQQIVESIQAASRESNGAKSPSPRADETVGRHAVRGAD